MPPPAHKKLGDLLIEMGRIDALQLKAALGHAEQWGMLLGKALVEKRFCSEADITRAIAMQTRLPVVDLDSQVLDSALASVVPVRMAERHRVVPMRLEGKRHEVLVVAIGTDLGLETLDEVRNVARKQRVTAFVANDSAIDRALGYLYHNKPREVAPPQAPPVLEAKVENEATFELEPSAKVWLLGWHDAREKALKQMLHQAQVESLPLPDDALDRCVEGDVVLSSTLALQALLPAGQRFTRARLIICGLAEDLDIQDAKSMGARMYLRPPFTPEQLARAIKSLKAEPKA